MTNTKPHLEPMEAIDYLRFIPPELHQEAKNFIVYVTSRPYAKATCCAHCGARSFYTDEKFKVPQYRCKICKKSFTSLTGTPFSWFHSHDIWEDVAILMLAGIRQPKSFHYVAPKGRVTYRERALETVMQEGFTNLYQWWLLLRYQAGTPTVEMPPQVKIQHDKFQTWLHSLLSPKIVICPNCQSQKCALQRDRQNQAGYRCGLCRRRFSLLAPTRFKKINHISKLPDIFNLILRGTANTEIMSERAIYTWRNKFMAQLRDLNLDLLADWVEWKHACRLRERQKQRLQIKKEQVQSK